MSNSLASIGGNPRVGRCAAHCDEIALYRNYQLHFHVTLRNGPTDPLMPMAVEQQSLVELPERLFFINGQMFAVPMTAYYRYIGPQSTFNR